jgi:chromosome partitioning protein
MGNDLLSNLLKYYSEPHEKKTLRYWKMKDACQMIGRSEAFLRKLENDDPTFTPYKDATGIRQYDLSFINRVRDKANTRYKRPNGSKPIVLAVSNFKGGVAKSTTSLHLVQKCALIGLRCLVIDLDPQATLSLGFGYVPDIDVQTEETIRSALIESPDKIKALVQKTYFDGIDIIPGNLSLSDLEINLSNFSIQEKQSKNLGMPNIRIQNAINQVSNNYDVIVIDCGPNLGMLTINAVTAANALLVPIPPMMNDLGSFVTFTGTLDTLFSQLNKNFDFFRIVLTKHPESILSKQIEILMRERFGAYILQKNIVNSVEIEKASSSFSSVYEVPRKSTKTYKRAIESLDNVFNEVIDAFKYIWKTQSDANQDK